MSRLALVLAFMVATAGAVPGDVRAAPRPGKTATTLYVSPTGADAAQCGAQTKPCRTISHTLGRAKPGTTIIVLEGTYGEYLVTKTNGKPDRPITLRAEGSVVLTGDEAHGRIFELKHDYYSITGFEFSGAEKQKDKLLWLQEADHNTMANNFFHHAQGECVRAKYHSSDNVFSRNRLEYCGQLDFGGGGTGKNGEGIYIGTAPEQLFMNPTPETDDSNDNVVRNNSFATFGNECVDIKEGSGRNLIEFNDCTGQLDPKSGGFDSRGNNNTFRYNKSYSNVGAGIRFGGDTVIDGINNEAYGNEITDNQGYALKVMRLPQGLICGNVAEANAAGFSNESLIENAPCDFPLLAPGVQP